LLAGQPGLSARQAREAMQKLREKLGGQKQQLDREALEPLEHLAKVYPLLEDAARFADLYQQQRALAERLASLKGRDRGDDPALKARMRDLQNEQQELREGLAKLLEEIDNH